MFWSPKRKVDVGIRQRLSTAGHDETVDVTVVVRNGADDDVAAGVRANGGTVVAIIRGAHVIAARLPLRSILPIAALRGVREIALERSSTIA